MQSTDTHDEQEIDAPPPGRMRRRIAYALMVLLAVLLLAFIPPLINVSRFQRRVDSNISAALGRPVHFDSLSLNLLPMPGFTLENFVIEEDPAFGYEPTLHADEVQINLRLTSLWRGRVEFSSISFTDPSVNLVHTSDGRWNVQGLLLQASHISAAPTVQRHAGPAPRFPYIQATGARLNLKLDQEKTPVSLTDADFALWQPAEHQWRLRLEAHPVRTDMAPGETGTLHLEGTLGAAETIASLAEIPIDLQGTWQDAQLGGLTSLLLGRDAGLRGGLALNFGLQGTIGRNAITAALDLENARRAEFIPARPLSLRAGCSATAESSFHAFTAIECRLPPEGSSGLSGPAMLAVSASVPDVRRPELARVRLIVPALPARTFFDWLSVATPHPPTAFSGAGTLAGELTLGAADAQMAGGGAMQPAWSGELTISGESLSLPALGPDPLPLEDIVLRSTPAETPLTGRPPRMRHVAANSAPAPDSFDLLPVSLALGGKQPATISGNVNDAGYTLHLAGTGDLERLLALGDAIPQFGSGLRTLLAPPTTETPADADAKPGPPAVSRGRGVSAPAKPVASPPIAFDLTAVRSWGGPQVWTEAHPIASSAQSQAGTALRHRR